MSELSSSLAHELNQPLAIILTNAQAAQRLLAQDPPDIAETRDILADIVSEDQRAGDVIRRLRALLKPGQTQLLPLPVNEIIEDVLRIARSDLIGRGITVHTTLADGEPQVSGDRIQLQQVLLNLILNASDAMIDNPPAQRLLSIATSRIDGMIRISVSDNGCGLPADPERIFQSFYTTKKKAWGWACPFAAPSQPPTRAVCGPKRKSRRTIRLSLDRQVRAQRSISNCPQWRGSHERRRSHRLSS